MRVRGAFLAVWLGVLALTPAHAASAADAILTQSNGALASGQYEAAQTLANGGLAENGLNGLTRSRLLIVRGLARQAQGQASEALVDFTQGLQGDALQGEERARALFARGLSLDGLGRLETAIGDYSAALRLSPRATYALNNRANVYRRQGRIAEARRDYAAALEAGTPNPQYPYFGLGQIAEAAGDIQTARDFYRKAVAADAGFGLALARLQALGAPVDEPGSMRPDTGLIVLKPPPYETQAPAFLKPPSATKQVMAERSPAPIPVADTQRRARPVSVPPPGRGAALRPAIVEGGIAAGALVQLGAWRSEAEARQGWSVVLQAAGSLLEGLSPIIVTADLQGRGRFYRLRIAARGAVTAFCAQLQGRGVTCIPVRD